MFAKILGAIWVLLGTWWFIKPESLKNRLARKMNRRMRRVVLAFVLVFGFLLMGSVFKAPGMLSKVIGVIGLIVAIKAIMMITSKTSEKALEWWGARPVIFFRIWAFCIFVVGVMLMFVQKG